MNNNTENREQKDFTLLRVFAILLVVFGHSGYTAIGSPFGGVDYSSTFTNDGIYSFIQYIISIIYVFHMPLFVFISGAIYFLGIKKNYKFDVFFEKKFKRLLIPYFTVALVYMVPLKLWANYYNFGNLKNAIGYGIFLTLDSGHLWFIFMLFNIFILFYLLEKGINKIYTPIVLGVMILIHLSSYTAPTNIFQFTSIGKYLVFFYIGYLFQKYKDEILNVLNKRKFVYLVGTFLYFIILFRFLRQVPPNIFNALLFVEALLGITLSYLIILNVMRLKILNTEIVRLLDRFNFEIYLLHDPLNYVLLAFFSRYGMLSVFAQNGMNTIIFVSIRFFVALIVPILIMITINKAKKKIASLNRLKSESVVG